MEQDKTAQAGTAAQANTTQADAAMQTSAAQTSAAQTSEMQINAAQAGAAQTLQAINIDGVKLTDVFNEIVQVGIVVENMDAAIKGMKQVFDLDPDATSDNYYKNTWYRGEIITAPAKAAFYNFFNVQLEFLQPIDDDPSIWQDYLKEGPHHGHALHHLRFNVEDNDVASALMERAGVAKYMEGQSLVDPTARFTYYDAVPLVGFIIEAVTKPKDE